MAKNSFFNIGKGLYNEISEKLLKQGKDILATSKTEFVEKSKEAFKDTVNEKFSDLTQGFFREESKERSSSLLSEKSKQGNATPQKEKEINTLQPSVTVRPAEKVIEEDKYADAEQFEENLHTGLNGLVKGLAAGNPAEAATVLKTLVTMAGEVSKFTEVQKTKRKEIEAQRDVYVNKIQAQKEIMLVYLEKSFDERKTNFEELFKVVDQAIANNNMDQLAMGLQSINTLAATSPFKVLSTIESTQQALNDKNHVWDF